jgi:hypothetical protein
MSSFTNPKTPDAVPLEGLFLLQIAPKTSRALLLTTDPSLPVDQSEELISRLRTLPHRAQHAAGSC